MGKMVLLRDYRLKRRKEYLAKYGIRLEQFISTFLQSRIRVSFSQITELYLATQRQQDCDRWDYDEMRESISAAIHREWIADMMAQLQETWWFDRRWLSEEELAERCLSAMVLARAAND